MSYFDADYYPLMLFSQAAGEGSSSRLYPELLEFFPGRPDLNMKAAEILTQKSLVKGDYNQSSTTTCRK